MADAPAQARFADTGNTIVGCQAHNDGVKGGKTGDIDIKYFRLNYFHIPSKRVLYK
jgi:hypothetical protein